MGKRIVIIICLFSVVGDFYISAQYFDAQTQFTRNEILLNPAYAASKEYYTFSGYVRKQWMGIEGSPTTQSVSFFGPVPHKNIGLGMCLLNDQIGVTKQQMINVSYAYKVDFRYSSLSLGLLGGLKFFSNDYSKLLLDSQSDVNFEEYEKAYKIPFFGLGMYFEKKTYSLGLSVPIFLQNVFLQYKMSMPIEDQLFMFFMGSYLYQLNNGWAIKSGVLMKGAMGSSFEIDLMGKVFVNRNLNIGLSYKSLNSICPQVEYGYKSQFYFSFSYDISTTKLIYNQYGTPEVTLTYILDKRSRRYYKNPRYF